MVDAAAADCVVVAAGKVKSLAESAAAESWTSGDVSAASSLSPPLAFVAAEAVAVVVAIVAPVRVACVVLAVVAALDGVAVGPAASYAIHPRSRYA